MIFDGWYFNELLTAKVEWPIILDKDYTVYAKWKEYIAYTYEDYAYIIMENEVTIIWL